MPGRTSGRGLPMNTATTLQMSPPWRAKSPKRCRPVGSALPPGPGPTPPVCGLRFHNRSRRTGTTVTRIHKLTPRAATPQQRMRCSTRIADRVHHGAPTAGGNTEWAPDCLAPPHRTIIFKLIIHKNLRRRRARSDSLGQSASARNQRPTPG